MKVKELISELEKQPQDLEVFIFDWRKNLHDGFGDSTSSGVYNFEIEHLQIEDKGEQEFYEEKYDKPFVPWVALAFKSDDYTDDGECLID